MKKYTHFLLRKYVPLFVIIVVLGFSMIWFFVEDPNNKIPEKFISSLEIKSVFNERYIRIVEKKSIQEILRYLNSLDLQQTSYGGNRAIRGESVIIVKINYTRSLMELVLKEKRLTIMQIDDQGNISEKTHYTCNSLDLNNMENFLSEFD